MTVQEQSELQHELKDAAVIDAVLRTYERGNAQNLIALCYLQRCLDSLRTPETDRSANNAAANPVGDPVSMTLNADQKARERADGVFGPLPNLPAMETLPQEIQSLIARSAEIWVPAAFKGLTPSVFRHLSWWPGLLELYKDRLVAIEHNSVAEISLLSEQALKTASHHALWQAKPDAGLHALSHSDADWLDEVLDVFINGMLSRGVVIVPTLRAILPR